jgi:hypothetical protein
MERPYTPSYVINEHVSLNGIEGDVFAILKAVRKAMHRDGTTEMENFLGRFLIEAMDGDYDHFLKTCEKWVVFDKEEKK